MDPLAGTPWSSPSTVAGFAGGTPNPTLVEYTAHLLGSRANARALDIGCGAGRNAVPLAQRGWQVVGLDLSVPMLQAAQARAQQANVGACHVLLAGMDALPIADASMDLVIAHGIWNLSTSDAQFRRAVREAARVSRPGAGLFVFTFSRHALPEDATPEAEQTFIYRQFSGQPQCFLTESQLFSEMQAAGFERDAAVPFVEHNRPNCAALRTAGTPVIYEAAFRFTGKKGG
ncbi:MAG: class I SAM-dependent methyltransferase [Vicinamibacterales bacterium]